MQTPSHFLISALVSKRFGKGMALPIHTFAFLTGSVLPDIPFTLLTLGYEAYYGWFKLTPPNGGSVMEYLHFDLFFVDPVWIISHNFFHSLVVNVILLCLGYFAFKRAYRWGIPIFWLSGSMMLHTIIDIFTHNRDGPLIFFPLNWTYRFASPVSYWEVDHYGLVFMIFEYALDLTILGYLGYHKWRRV